MLNLLMTIISIGLTAAMAGLGVYYGGSVLTANGGKVSAVQIVQTMQQIDLAWQAYAADGGIKPAMLTFVGPYLNALPAAPPGAVGTGCTSTDLGTCGGSNGWNLDSLTLTSLTPDNSNDVGIWTELRPALTPNAANICQQIAQNAGQIAAGAPVPTVTTVTFHTYMVPYRYACVQVTDAVTTLGVATGNTALTQIVDTIDANSYLVYLKL